MKKRFLFLIVLLVAICVTTLTLFPAEATGEIIAEGTCGDNLTWTLDDAGLLTISGEGDIPGYSETDAAPWFSKRTKITSVVIEDGVTCLGSYAFYACLKLETVTIADTVTYIGGSVFRDCGKLMAVAIPEGVQCVYGFTFSGCTALESITIPSTVVYIADYAFNNCTALSEVHIADVGAWCKIDFYDYAENPLYYGASLYLNNEPVTTLDIPDGTTEISDNAFYGCASITSVTIPDSTTSIGEQAFGCCNNLTSVTIGNGVTSIGVLAFVNCSNLVSVAVGSGVQVMYRDAFYGCSQIEAVYIQDLSAWCKIDFIYGPRGGTYDVEANPLHSKAELYLNEELVTDLIVPEDVSKILPCTFYGCTSVTSVTLPEGIAKIEAYAFTNCSNLTSINIPEGVTSIGKSAFSGCRSLTSINIPEGVTSISDSLFQYCSSLTSITIPESVTSIGSFAFRDCSSLTDIYIADITSWLNISFVYVHSAFDNYYSSHPLRANSLDKKLYINGDLVTDLIIPESVATIPDYAFFYITNITSLVIPEGVTDIGVSAFAYCSGLGSVIIPEGVTSIGNSAFSGCNSLTSVTIPDSVTSIGKSAFKNCCSLECMTLPFVGGSLTSQQHLGYIFGASVYSGNDDYVPSSLNTVVLSNACTSIVSCAFYDCSSLTIVTIPDTVSSIGGSAFYGCNNLWHVLYKGTEEEWNAISIGSSNSNLTSATRHYECIGDEISDEITLVPTCTETGTRVHTCSICEKSKEITLSALGHKWQPATCTDPKTCLRCSITEGEPLEGSNGHEYTSVVTPPTCAEQGYTTYTCTRCSYSYVGDYTETLPHNWGGSVATEPTCTAQGYTTYTCADCGHIHTEYDVEPLGHDYKGVYTPPTYTKEGFTTFTCTRCGDSYVDNFVEKLELVIGDVDGDGDADSADAMWILRYDAWEIDRFPIQEMIGDSLDMALNLRDALDLHSQTCGTPASQQSGAGLSNYICSICANGNALGSLSAPAMKPAQLQQAVTPAQSQGVSMLTVILIAGMTMLCGAAMASGVWLMVLKKKN